MRVGIVALLQESNTFLAERTTLEHFRTGVLATGQDVAEQFAGTHHEVAGFFASLAAAEIEAVPIFAARAVPFGVIAGDAWQELMSIMLSALDDAGPLDGVLVAPHGATVSEPEPDADGFWLSQLRADAGPGGADHRHARSHTPICRSGWSTPATRWWPTGRIPISINLPADCGPPI